MIYSRKGKVKYYREIKKVLTHLFFLSILKFHFPFSLQERKRRGSRAGRIVVFHVMFISHINLLMALAFVKIDKKRFFQESS